MSSTVASVGMLMVFEIAPEMNGCTAPIMRMWPSGGSSACPRAGLKAQSKTGRCSSCRCGAPSMVSCSSMYSTMSWTSRDVVAETLAAPAAPCC